MPVTRIKNNQITDLTVNAAAKLQDFSVTSAKIANNLTYDSNLVVTGNLTVQGNVTAIDTQDLVVEDPLIVLAKDQIGTPSLDIGYIGVRGDEDNIAFVWDESADQFVMVFTDSEITNTTITINSYASLKVLDFEAANVTFTGNTTVGNITVTGDSVIDMGNLKISNVAEPVANSDAATKAYVDSQSASGFTIEDDTANTTVVSGGDTLELFGTSNEVTVLITDTDQITFGLPSDVTIANTLSVTVDAIVTGNVTGGNINTAGQVVATGNVTGGNITTAGDVTTATVTASGNVSGGNLVTAGDVTTATVTASGNVSGGNITTAGSVVATGNVSGGNITTAGDVTTATVTASGNVSGGNLVTAGSVVATGNVTGGNITTAGDVSGASGTFTGNVSVANLVATGDVSGTTGTFTGDVSAANVDASTAVNTDLIAGTGLQIVSTGDLDLQPTGNISVSGVLIRDVSDPLSAQDAATKQYVDDAVSSGIHIHTPVDVETPTALPTATYAQGGNTFTVNETVAGNTVVFTTAANLQVNDQLWFDNSFNGVVGNLAYFVVSTPNTSAAVLSTAYNGTPVSNITSGSGLTESVRVNSGIGATLTATANAALVVDGFSVSAGNRVLVYNQSTTYENGIYDVTDAGNVTAPWILTRSADADTYIPDTSDGLDEGTYVYVKFGDTGAGESYVQTAPTGPFIIGLANVVFTQFSASQVYSANTQAGINLTGTVFSAKVDLDTTAFDGGGNIKVKDGANLVTPNIGDATGNSLTLSGNGLVSATTGTFTGNVSGGNLTTAGDVTTATVTASGNVSGGNITTAGDVTTATVTASGNVSGGNLTTGGAVDATGNVSGGNLIAVGDVSGATLTISGNIDGANLNATSAVTAGTTVTAVGNVSGGNLVTAGDVTTATVTASGNVSGGNITTAGDVTTATVTASGNVSGGNLVTAGDVTTATVTASGNVSGGNIAVTGIADLGNIRIEGDDITNKESNDITINAAGADINLIVSGDNQANLLVVDAGTDTVLIGTGTPTVGASLKIGTTDSFMPPVGNLVQRPATPQVGMLRFSTSDDALEVYTSGDGWEVVGVPSFTVIVADEFTGNGVQTAFTLSEDSTTAATIVSINGVVQIPTTAYAVSGNVLTFTEAPESTDVIDARLLTTTTTVTGIRNISGNAEVQTLDTADTVQITGNLLPPLSNVYDLGSSSLRWNELFLQGSTITLGNVVIKNTTANTISFFGPDGATEATLQAGSIDVSSISQGTTTIGIDGANGNAFVTVDGTANVLVVTPTTVVTGNISTANLSVTGSADIEVISAANVTITGNLTVNGTTITANVANVVIVDPIIGLGSGANGDPLTTNDGFDRGIQMFYYTTAQQQAFVGFDNDAGKIISAANVTVANSTVTVNSYGNTVVGNLESTLVTATGNITGGNVITAGLVSLSSITKTGANGAGNIGQTDNRFDTIFAKATSAEYADLAEMYKADGIINPGTVVAFGGVKEVTISSVRDDTRVAGVISTNPSYIMNSALTDHHQVVVALTGRVPTKVTGTIRKGDMMVSAGDGSAYACASPSIGTVIGKALEDFDGESGIIEVVVGRL